MLISYANAVGVSHMKFLSQIIIRYFLAPQTDILKNNPAEERRREAEAQKAAASCRGGKGKESHSGQGSRGL